MIKKIIFIALTIAFKINAQVNLVPNPGFETYTTCPDGSSQLNYTGNWYAPTTGSPDFFDTCFTFSQPWTSEADVPSNFVGYQPGHLNSAAYSGVIAFAYAPNVNTYREYIQTKLTSTLVAGQKYYLSFRISLADFSVLIVDDFGAYLSSNAVSLPNYSALNFTPQVSNPQGQYLNDSIYWKKISGSFIAQGNEEYITIGNFKNDANTDTIRIHPNNWVLVNEDDAYYYIDNICLSTDSIFCNPLIEGVSEKYFDDFKVLFDLNHQLIIIKSNGHVAGSLCDIYGRKIKQIVFEDDYAMDVSDLTDGYYIFYLRNSRGEFRKKFIYNKPQQK